jgi:uroporphyrinogen-III synthase
MSGTLTGRHIVVTRADEQASELHALLRREGAHVTLAPCIRISPVQDTSALDASLLEAARGGFHWLVFTSANAAAVTVERVRALGLGGHLPVRVAAIGRATAEVWPEGASLTWQRASGKSFHEALALEVRPGERVLLPQSSEADKDLETRLAAHGARVTRLVAYMVTAGDGGAQVAALLREHPVDALTFTSGSTVRYFAEGFTRAGSTLADLAGVPSFSLGTSARAALAAFGLSPVISAPENAISSLVSVIRGYFHAG